MKKLFALLMTIVMLAMPVLSLAASPEEMLDTAWQNGRSQKATVSLELDEAVYAMMEMDAESAALVKELLNAMAYSITTQPDGVTKVAMELSGQEAVNVTFEATEKELYIASSLMGEKVVAMTEEEFWITLGHFVDFAVVNDMMDEEQAAEAKAAIPMIKEMLHGEMLEEQLISMIPEIDLEGVLNVAFGWVSKATVNEVSGQSRDYDVAAQEMVLNLNADDISDMVDAVLDMLKTQPELAAEMGVDVSEIEETKADSRATLKRENAGVVIRIMLDAEENPVYMSLELVGSATDPSVVLAKAEYKRQTNAQGVGHAVTMMIDGGNDGVLSVNWLTGNENREYFDFSAAERTGVEPVMNFVYNNNKHYTDTTASSYGNMTLNIFDGDITMPLSIAFIVDAAVNGQDVTCDTVVGLGIMGMDLFRVKVNTVTGEPLPSIQVEKAARPGKMTFEEFNADMNNKFANSAMLNVMTALQLLPESILELMME